MTSAYLPYAGPDHKSLSNVPFGVFGLFSKDALGIFAGSEAILERFV